MSEEVRIWGPFVMFARPVGPPFLRLFSIAGDLTRFLKGFIVRFLGQNELAEAARGLTDGLGTLSRCAPVEGFPRRTKDRIN